MRLNEPVTSHEIEIPDGEPLVSKTDTGGRITFANRVFVEVSGYPLEELIGAPHNLVRHPHMPTEAFADLWATIKAGRPWEGLVKNRTKQGDFYWVRASVTPVVEDGAVAGYVSIRSKPTRQQIAEAETAYRMLRAGSGRKIGLRDGMLIRRTRTQRWHTAWSSVLGRLVATGMICALIIAAAGWIGLQGMSTSNQALQTVYARGAVETARITDIRAGLRGGVQLLTLLALELRAERTAPTGDRIRAIQAGNDRVDALMRDALRTSLPPAEAELVRQFIDQRTSFLRDGVQPAIVLAQQRDAAGLDQHLHTRVIPLFEAAAATNNRLVDLLVKQSEAAFNQASRDFAFRFWAVMAMMAAGGAVLIGFGTLLLRTLARPLRQVGRSFDAIARNDLTRDIEMPATREFWQIFSLLRSMRARLAYASHERAEIERRALVDRRSAVREMAEHVERDAGHAMEQVAAQTGEMASQADGVAEMTERVSSNAQSVTDAVGQALANAQAVGAASEQLSASIQEIASQISRATEVAQRAVCNGAEAQVRIRSLSDGAVRIGDVVQLIRNIAGQTNLLALNATIEAARAGEAGRGFNVVASEVKGLAGQTAHSTEEISRQVAAIQAATSGAVAVVADLGGSIEEIAQVFTGIAAAIEQQAAATQEIARNVAENSIAVRAITERITDVSRDAAVSRERADGIRSGSAAVAESIGVLRSSIVRTIRTATTDADRRMEARLPADEPCTVVWKGNNEAGRLVDVARTGARLITAHQIPVGGAGSLSLGHGVSAANAGFEVRSVHPDGGLGVAFDQTQISAAFATAMQRLAGGASTERAA
jgi:PAS domain S-box-containing protein